MEIEHQRWYDLEPTVSLAVSLIRNSDNKLRLQCAEIITNHAKDFGVVLPDDIFNNFNYILKRWYDEERTLTEALEYLKNSPEELRKEISFQIIEFLETQEIENV